ncbi:hypothetical protein GGX14DRAFT_582907 [Mycena pura]|uniref:Uncharacterized protein n=1 Tax=Mycena pura TaxID=153505 RepID=A0AAD6YVI2_9AGAR|nr:hypothetical protein GGX14DRAFT_582907 [Mycena pura]
MSEEEHDSKNLNDSQPNGSGHPVSWDIDNNRNNRRDDLFPGSRGIPMLPYNSTTLLGVIGPCAGTSPCSRTRQSRLSCAAENFLAASLCPRMRRSLYRAAKQRVTGTSRPVLDRKHTFQSDELRLRHFLIPLGRIAYSGTTMAGAQNLPVPTAVYNVEPRAKRTPGNAFARGASGNRTKKTAEVPGSPEPAVEITRFPNGQSRRMATAPPNLHAGLKCGRNAESGHKNTTPLRLGARRATCQRQIYLDETLGAQDSVVVPDGNATVKTQKELAAAAAAAEDARHGWRGRMKRCSHTGHGASDSDATPWSRLWNISASKDQPRGGKQTCGRSSRQPTAATTASPRILACSINPGPRSLTPVTLRDKVQRPLHSVISLNGGENGWELWNRLCHEELLKVLKVPVEPGVRYTQDILTTRTSRRLREAGAKKRRAKPPRGAVKKQKVTGEQDKPQRKKKVVSNSAASRMATRFFVNSLRHKSPDPTPRAAANLTLHPCRVGAVEVLRLWARVETCFTCAQPGIESHSVLGDLARTKRLRESHPIAGIASQNLVSSPNTEDLYIVPSRKMPTLTGMIVPGQGPASSRVPSVDGANSLVEALEGRKRSRGGGDAQTVADAIKEEEGRVDAFRNVMRIELTVDHPTAQLLSTLDQLKNTPTARSSFPPAGANIPELRGEHSVPTKLKETGIIQPNPLASKRIRPRQQAVSSIAPRAIGRQKSA